MLIKINIAGDRRGRAPVQARRGWLARKRHPACYVKPNRLPMGCGFQVGDVRKQRLVVQCRATCKKTLIRCKFQNR